MKSVNLDVLQLVSTLVAAGEITIPQLNEAIAESRGLNQPCGAAADFHGHFYTLFVATDKEDRNKVTRSKDGVRVKINLRAQGTKKKQEAQTLGQALPAGQAGVPAVTAAGLKAIQDLLDSVAPRAAAPLTLDNEADFSDLNKTLPL